MNRHIFGISTYFLTFFLSIIVVALFGGFKKQAKVEVFTVSTNAPLSRNYETVEQREIRKFLETDRSFANKQYQAENRLEREEFIIQDMNDLLDNSSLPAEIQIAYRENIIAWDKQLKHLEYAEIRNYHSEPDEECAQRIKEINFTYENLLKTAKKYGVDYR